MTKITRDNRSYRGMLQSDDGVICKVLEHGPVRIIFQTVFGLS